MINLIMPNMYFKSIYDINYKLLKNNKIKCIIFSLDNTLAPLNLKSPNKKIKDLIEELNKMNFKVIIVSNADMERVEPFKEILSVDSAYSSKKPSKNKFKKILKLYKLKPEEVALVGNLIFSDILAANRMKFTSILVNSIGALDASSTKMLDNYLYNYLTKNELLIKGKYYE